MLSAGLENMIMLQAHTTCGQLQKEPGELMLKALEEVAAFQSTLRDQMLPTPTTACYI